MAKLTKISNTSWTQPFQDRKKEFHLWGSQSEVADYCDLKDGTKRLLQITFEPQFEMDIIDFFQITSGKEISFPRALQELIKPIIVENPSSCFVVTVLDQQCGEPSTQEALNTEGFATVKTRIGQKKFRTDLFEYWGGCAISGVKLEAILKASHIRPWKDADDFQKLDPFNGILLAAHYDSLFDQGYISFNDSGEILLSKSAKALPAAFGLSADIKLSKIDEQHKKYLSDHRKFFDPNR